MPHLPIALRRYLEVSGQPAGSAFHTSQVSISFGEAVDADALKSAWEAVAGSHDALRTTFGPEGDIVVAPAAEFAWQSLDWQSAPPEELGAAWQELQQGDAARAIAADSEPCCRITFLRLPNGGGHALWSFHGALLDLAAVSAVLQRWLVAYDALRAGAECPSFPTAAASEPAATDWKAAFEGFVPPRPLLVLPLPDATSTTGARRSITRTFERPERAAFAAAAESMSANLRSLFGAAWAFVVARAASSEDALLLENQPQENVIGRGEQLAVFRRSVEAAESAADLVRAFGENNSAALPDPKAAAQELGLPAAALEPAAAFLYRDHTLNDLLQLELPRWMAADVQLFQLTAPAIALRITASDRPEVALDYDPTRLSHDAAKLLFDLFLGTLEAFVADPKLVLPDFALPAPAGIVEGGEAPATFRSLVPQCLHELFADIATEAPDAIAIESGETKLTFSQLNNEANQLARHLRKSGVQAGARVGIAMPRSPRWAVALLGAWKAGACVVPLPASAAAPAAGIKFWIVDALAEGEARDLPVIAMQADASAISGEKIRGIQNDAAPASPALAGIPEAGAPALTHEKLAAALQGTSALLGLTPADRMLQFAPTHSFAALEEFLVTLLSGATLVLPEDGRWSTRTAFQEFIESRAITALSIPTPFWSQWTHYLAGLSLGVPSSLRIAATHGDFPSPNVLAAWRTAAGDDRLLFRTSSPAAAGIGLAGAPTDSSFLGAPAPATTAQLVDKRGLPLPAGLAGWVDVATREGDPVPLGVEAYLSPENVFHARSTLQALVCGPSSDVITDSIRLAATTHPEVLDAHVEQRIIAARQEWCVWIVPRDAEKGEPHDFREWLAARLPSAPRRIRALPRLPLDENGSVDRTALNELLPDDGLRTASQKGTEEEERVRKAISRVLGGRHIELDENISDGRTKAHIAKLLHEAVVREESRVLLSDITAGFSVRSLLRNVRSRKSQPDSRWTPLEPLRASGRQTPLILVHDIDGSSKLYGPLAAHLGGEQPCYAITARGLTDPAACHASISEMAAAYVEALRIFDANGPYQLAGYGFGGLVAFEMARQLLDAGAEVSLLALLATEPPRSGIGNFLSGGWKNLFAKKTEDTGSRRRNTVDSPVARANQEAARKFTPAPAQVVAHVFAPTEGFPPYRTIQSGWETFCAEVRLYQVPCSGPDMMVEPAVESLAQVLSSLARNEDPAAQNEE